MLAVCVFRGGVYQKVQKVALAAPSKCLGRSSGLSRDTPQRPQQGLSRREMVFYRYPTGGWG